LFCLHEDGNKKSGIFRPYVHHTAAVCSAKDPEKAAGKLRNEIEKIV